MIIEKLKITDLFDQFNYLVDFENDEQLTIITGPNGYGKTMILNIMFNFFNQRFNFFQKLVFKKIEIYLTNNIIVEITKKKAKAKKTSVTTRFLIEDIENNEDETVSIRFLENEEVLDSIIYSNITDEEFSKKIGRYLPVQRISTNQWFDQRYGKVLSQDDILNEYSNQLPAEFENITPRIQIKSKEILEIFKSTSIHLIKEQRLLRTFVKRYSEKEPILTNTIQEYALELRDSIRNIQSSSFMTSQELDSTFPKRLLEERGRITEKDFNKKYKSLVEKQNKLKKFGLSSSKQEVLNQYNKSDAKALLVYLNDSFKKIEIFDEILERIELFTSILNERRFSFKTIQVNPNNGFSFLTSKDKPLNLSDLSSGEQHEVVLLYELIFKAKPNTIVLIDEPEISLHIAWQNEFLKDIKQIIKLQNINVVIATHSPQIIDENWHLTVNLDKQVSK